MHKRAGLRRVLLALSHGYSGMRYGVANDPAIREVLIAVVILVPVSFFLPVGDVQHLLLVLSLMQVFLVECINSALEAVVDRISLERHELSGYAKDLGSVAVGVAVLMSGLCWLVIAGPLFIAWLRGTGA